MVCGEVWEGGSTQPTGRQEHALYRTEVDFGGGNTGTLYLTGWQGNDCGGVSSVQVVWDGGGGTLFFTRDAIAAQWGEDSGTTSPMPAAMWKTRTGTTTSTAA